MSKTSTLIMLEKQFVQEMNEVGYVILNLILLTLLLLKASEKKLIFCEVAGFNMLS